MSVTNLPISGWNVDCLSKILHGIGRVIGHDKISLKFTSLYALRILIGTMSWEEEDDQSGDLESADADLDNNVDVEMNTSVDDADRDNFELQYNSSLDQFRRQELGLSPMDSHNRMTDSNRQCDMDRQTHNSYITQRSRYSKEIFLFNTGSLQNTAEEVEESSMDTAIRMGNRRWLQERNLQIADCRYNSSRD
ncbi:hypothetical protein NC653_028689 [Populus alba x Populus x berolinensis]|uniref:Uncharacterized protein n=1 Tax=Populus alba x Populus x berolinensis TaxID=444605 RepID=A0AAD6M0D6_9ROSI|nr:hypothetical protein NC653_028689 [Populus alba x Populus x berolinensis]